MTMTEIPFHMLREGVPIITVPVHINGEGPFEFVLDTGNAAGKTATFLVCGGLARRFALEASNCDEFNDAYAVGDGHRPEIRLGRLHSFAVGEIVRHDVPVGVTTMFDHLGEQMGAKIDGNLGYNFLKDYAVSIDYEAGVLRLDEGRSATCGEPFQLAVGEPLLVVPVLVNGQGPYSFAVDTGAGHTVISNRLAVELALERGKEVTVRGGAGDTGGFITHIDTLHLAGVACARMPVAVAGFFSALSAAAGMQLDGVIGYNVLCQHNVTIDYPRSTISLTKNIVGYRATEGTRP
jgi:Aspartyl protease